MASSVVFVPGWQTHLVTPLEVMMDSLGSAIAADAARLAPVLSGATRDSIEHHATVVDGLPAQEIAAHTDYAGYVEMGTSKTPAQPFIKPALYTARSL